MSRGLACFLVAADQPIGRGPEQGAEDGRQPEQPQLGYRPVAANSATPVLRAGLDRGVGHRNADQMDQGQRQADGNRRKARRRAAGRWRPG